MPNSNILMYTTEDGQTKVEAIFENDSVWLSIDQMAELFQRDRSVIGKHVRNIFNEGELKKDSVWAKFAYTASDNRKYDVDFYNLDVIISVGYRVKSLRGTQFRIWATGILKDYMKKGFALDDERLKRLGGGNYFDEFLPILLLDFLIGNTDRHQSNWALIMENKKLRVSPLYDNSSSLRAYVKESKIEQYLGKDLVLWKSLVDTKSKSLIRITNKDKGQPTHLEVLKFLQKNYYIQTVDTVKKIESVVTEQSVCAIVNKYEEVLSTNRKNLISVC